MSRPPASKPTVRETPPSKVSKVKPLDPKMEILQLIHDQLGVMQSNISVLTDRVAHLMRAQSAQDKHIETLLKRVA